MKTSDECRVTGLSVKYSSRTEVLDDLRVVSLDISDLRRQLLVGVSDPVVEASILASLDYAIAWYDRIYTEYRKWLWAG